MKKKDVVRKLKQAGWQIKPGSKHDMAKHPDRPGIKIPIPRHTELDKFTAEGILEDAGLL